MNHAPAHHAGAEAPEVDIPLTPCESSNLQAFGYHVASNTLDVLFKNGGHFRFDGVPAETAQAFHKADSKGGFFAAHLRGKYPSRKLGPRAEAQR